MNAYQEVQTSGHTWSSPPPNQLYVEQEYRHAEVARRVLEGIEQQIAQSIAEHETIMAELRKHFVLVDPSVQDFLYERRTLCSLLLDSVAHLRSFFGQNAVLQLRAPLDESGSRTLYAVVMWPGRIEDVRAALARFDEIWWLPQSRQASGYLNFTYELV